MKKNKLQHIKTTGFKVPKDYFESLEENLLAKTESKDTLNEIKNSGFIEPEHYFDALEDRISGKILEQNNEPKVISLFSKKTFWYASSIAAAIVLLFSITILNNDPTFNDLETETVENYILNENITTYEIASLLTEEELNDDNLVDYNFQEEHIEEYLLNNADIEALIIE